MKKQWGGLGLTAASFALLGCSASPSGSEEIGTTRQALASASVMSFDDVTKWLVTAGSAQLSNQGTSIEGTGSLGVRPTNGGWIELSSDLVTAPNTSDTLALGIRLPEDQPNPHWYGSVQLHVDVPSVGFSAYVGQAELSGLPTSTFTTLNFAVPAPVRAAIDAGLPDVRFRIALNVEPGSTGLYRFDHLRFVGATQGDTPEPSDAAVYERVLGFESAADWTSAQPNISRVLMPSRTQGSSALGVQSPVGGWFELRSKAVNPQGGSKTLLVDIKLPAFQPNQWWQGALQLYVEAPSVGLYNQYVGQVELTGLATEQFHTVKFDVADWILTELVQARRDLTFKLALSVPSGANRFYVFDNLRFDADKVAVGWPGRGPNDRTCHTEGALGGDYWKRENSPLRDDSPANVDHCWQDFTQAITSDAFRLPHPVGVVPWSSALVLDLRARQSVGAQLSDSRVVLERQDESGTWSVVQSATLPHDAKWNQVAFAASTSPGPYRVRLEPNGGTLSFDDARAHSEGLLPTHLRASSAAIVAPIAAPHVWGVADLHTHPASDKGFGGGLISGAAGDPTYDVFHTGGVNQGILMNKFSPGHGESGYPDFRDWPAFWHGSIHNQMHVQWLERAWRGGVRLIVASAVNNALLARYFLRDANNPPDRADMQAVRNQVASIKALVAQHGFMEIALTPSDARNIIAAGKLAVVLGAEIDDIGMCHANNPGVYAEQGGTATSCTQARVVQALDELQELGIRHVFPVHLSDNDFGGAAIYEDSFGTFQKWFRNEGFCLETAPPGSGISYEYGYDWWDDLQTSLFADLPPGAGPRCNAPAPHRNRTGLTALGEFAIRKMWERGMIVDIDHMSERMRLEVFDLAETTTSSLISGHTGFRAQAPQNPHNHGDRGNENSKTRNDLDAIRELNGVVGVGTGPGNVLTSSYVSVPNDCAGSSKTWLHRYAYASEALGGRGVGLATDMTLTAQVFPRFGSWACLAASGSENTYHVAIGNGLLLRTQADAQTQAVSYDTPLRSYHSRRFMRGDGDEASFQFRGKDHDCYERVGGSQVARAGCDARNYNAYSKIERAFFQAIVFAQSPANRNATGPLDGNGLNWGHDTGAVEHFMLGLRGIEVEAHNGCGAFNFGCGERRVAYLVSHGLPMHRDANGNVDEPWQVSERYDSLKRVWDNFHVMVDQGGNREAPLQRLVTGNREFDYNIDGLAHYGLLPDMFQDMSNLLRNAPGNAVTRDLGALFASANDFVEAWDRLGEYEAPEPPEGFDRLKVSITNGDGTLGENTTEGYIRLRSASGAIVGPNPTNANAGWLNKPDGGNDDGVWNGWETHDKTFTLAQPLTLDDIASVQIELEGNTSCSLSCKNWTIKTLHVTLVNSVTGEEVCLIDEDSEGNGNWYQDHVARLQEGAAEERWPGWRWDEVNLKPVGCHTPAITTGGVPSDPE